MSPPFPRNIRGRINDARHKFSFAGQQTLTKSPTINFTRAFPRVIPSPGLNSGKNFTRAQGSSRELRRICLHRSPPSRSPIRERPERTISRLKPQVGFGLSAVPREKLYRQIIQLLTISGKSVGTLHDTFIRQNNSLMIIFSGLVKNNRKTIYVCNSNLITN